MKGHEIAVSYLHLCHFAVKGLEMAAIISYPDKMEIQGPGENVDGKL